MGNAALSVAQVADRHGVTEATVLSWVASGELRAVDCGRAAGAKKPRWRVTPEALAAFELSRESGPAPVKARTKARRKPTGEVLKFD